MQTVLKQNEDKEFEQLKDKKKQVSKQVYCNASSVSRQTIDIHEFI